MFENLRGQDTETRLKEENYTSFWDVAKIVFEHADLTPYSLDFSMVAGLPDGRILSAKLVNIGIHTTTFEKL